MHPGVQSRPPEKLNREEQNRQEKAHQKSIVEAWLVDEEVKPLDSGAAGVVVREFMASLLNLRGS
jgi:hypothetical protein